MLTQGGTAELLAAISAGSAVALACPSRVVRLRTPPTTSPPAASSRSVVATAALSVMAGIGAWLFVGGPAGSAVGLMVAVGCFRVLRRAEPVAVRQEREQARRELPHLIGLLIAPLRSGASVDGALAAVCTALPGAAARRFEPTRRRLALGMEASDVWGMLLADAELGSLARAMARSAQTGADVVGVVTALADELATRDRLAVEESARQVGVRAALPLGLCLLPAFLLLGIVPVVAGLLATLTG